MLQTYLHRIYWVLGLLVVQVLIGNHLHIGGYATPMIYVYVLLKLGLECGRNARMLWGFAVGLLVDICSDTPGMNASASVLMCFVQPLLLRLFAPRDMADGLSPSLRTMGVAGFLKYLMAGILVHHTCLLSLEFFSWAHPLELLWHVLGSSLLTWALLWALEGIQQTKN